MGDEMSFDSGMLKRFSGLRPTRDGKSFKHSGVEKGAEGFFLLRRENEGDSAE